MRYVPNFDRVARSYRWMEYLTLGPLLQRMRLYHLPRLGDRRKALILGDGDGRFTERLLRANTAVEVTAVDLSGRMLDLLRQRACSERLATQHADARGYIPKFAPDLVVTHFFLDCLTDEEVRSLMADVAPRLAPGALWLVSDFGIPKGAWAWSGQVAVRLLYLAFRVLTGLRTTRLADFASSLEGNGFVCVAKHEVLKGFLTTELWRFPG